MQETASCLKLGKPVPDFELGRNIEELMRKLKANLYLSKNTAEVCPAKWRKPGDRTLTPSAKLVGRVHEAAQGA